MSNQTNIQKFKALAARLKFIQRRIFYMSSGCEKDDMCAKLDALVESIKDYYGPKISREIFWTTKEK